MHARTVCLLGMFLVGFLGALAIGAESTAKDIVQKLFAADAVSRQDAEKSIIAARKELIASLLQAIKDETNRTMAAKRGSTLAAVRILGELRAVEAADVLTEYITLPDDPEVLTLGVKADASRPSWVMGESSIFDRPLSNWQTVEALVAIGEPCLPSVMKRLQRSGADIRGIAACTRVLTELKGKEGAAALLKDALKTETNLNKREPLMKALALITSTPEDQRKKIEEIIGGMEKASATRQKF
jgi:hypothetical protein